MRIEPVRWVKLGLFFCLALTFYKGFMKLPEVYPVINPAQFYNGLENDGENAFIMKERDFDFNYQMGKALVLRKLELEDRNESPAEQALVTKDRVERAIRKSLAKDERNADSLVLAEQKLARARALHIKKWTMGWTACAPHPLTGSAP